MREIAFLASVVGLCGCAAVRHSPSPQAVFRIEAREGGLHLIPPSPQGGVVSNPIPFSQILVTQYGFNPWEQYVDLSPGMRLSVQAMTSATETRNSYYGIVDSGRRGLRVRSTMPEADAFDKRARYLRLFYQNKYVNLSGQPLRPGLFLWSDSIEGLKARTAEARQNPAFACDSERKDCLSFPGKTTVSPEVQILVNQRPRYVVLGSTVRELLRSDRVQETADIRMLRKFHNRMIPVTWQQKAFVMSLPLVAGDQMSW